MDRDSAERPVSEDAPHPHVAEASSGSASSESPETTAPEVDSQPETEESDDADERRYAGDTIAEWQARIKNLDPQNPTSAAAVPGLIAIVQDDGVSSFTRRQAALTLGRIGEPATGAVPVLVDLISGDEPEETAVWAIKSLALFGPQAKSSAPILVDTLQDGRRTPVERQACLEALGRIGTAHPGVVPALILTLQSTNTGDSPGVDKAAPLREGAADAVSLIGPAAAPAIPALIRAARDASEPVRRKAFAALGTMGGHAEIAAPAMVEAMLFDESAAVQDAAEESLAKVGPSVIPALVQLVHDDDEQIRLRAIRCLRRMGTAAAPAASQLRAALQDSDERVRIEAAGALLPIADDPSDILPVLVDGLTSRERAIRMEASRLLTQQGQRAQSAITSVERLLDHESSNVRRLAEETLEKLRAAGNNQE